MCPRRRRHYKQQLLDQCDASGSSSCSQARRVKQMSLNRNIRTWKWFKRLRCSLCLCRPWCPNLGLGFLMKFSCNERYFWIRNLKLQLYVSSESFRTLIDVTHRYSWHVTRNFFFFCYIRFQVFLIFFFFTKNNPKNITVAVLNSATRWPYVATTLHLI